MKADRVEARMHRFLRDFACELDAEQRTYVTSVIWARLAGEQRWLDEAKANEQGQEQEDVPEVSGGDE